MESKKSILVLTMSQQQSNYEVTRLVEEAEKMGIGVNRVLYRELEFSISNSQFSKQNPPVPPCGGTSSLEKGGLKNKARVLVRGEEVTAENTMGVWFRVAGTVSGKYVEARNLAIRLLGGQVFCTNAEGYLNWPRMGKIAQHGVFIENNIPVVPTEIFYQKSQILNPSHSPFDKGEVEHFFDWEYPIICKHERGYQGKSVRKFESAEEVEKWLSKMDEKNLGMYLWQKCLPTRWDLRVIVLGGKVLGAMKRLAKGDEFRSNFSLGGSVEKWNLSEEDKLLAEKVARVCGLDYCGVDIMKSPKSPSPAVAGVSPFEEKGKFKEENYNSYVLEVNRQCQFQGFEKATGINVAKAVVEMMLENVI